MRVIYHHTTEWISNSPSVTFVTYAALGFAKAGFETHLIVRNKSEEETEFILKKIFNVNSNLDNLKIHRINWKNKRDYYKKSYEIIKGFDEGDIVISRALTFLPSLIKLKKIGFNVFFEMHDFYTELFQRYDIKKFKKLKHYTFEKLYFPKLDGIICLQSAQKELVDRNYRTKTLISKTGINKIADINYDEIAARKYLAYIGSFDIHKGVFDLLRSISKYPEIPLKLIGGKNKNEILKMQELSKEICPENEIIITGWLDKKQLKGELKNVKYGLIPLTNTYFNQYLTSPLKLFDYYSELIPVLVSDLPSLKDLVIDGKTGFFIDWKNVDYNKLMNIDRENYLKMCEEIKKISQELLWENRSKKLIEKITCLS